MVKLQCWDFSQPQASSSEGIPGELIEDSKFIPLNAKDPRYGPPVSFGSSVIFPIHYGDHEPNCFGKEARNEWKSVHIFERFGYLKLAK